MRHQKNHKEMMQNIDSDDLVTQPTFPLVQLCPLLAPCEAAAQLSEHNIPESIFTQVTPRRLSFCRQQVYLHMDKSLTLDALFVHKCCAHKDVHSICGNSDHV